MDPIWYTNNATTNHITSDLDKITMKETYCGHDQVLATNGTGMTIKHAGKSMVFTPSQSIFLNNVSHVSQVARHLASIHHLTVDNDVFLELHPYFFLIKDQLTRRTLLHE
jgi:hypothetical protein